MRHSKKIFSIIILIIILAGSCYSAGKSVGNFLTFIDIPSIIIVFVIAFAYSLNKKNKIKEFGNGAVYGGWLGFLIGLVSMSFNFSSTNFDAEKFFLLNSVLWLIVFYGYSVKLITKILDS